MYYFYGLIIFPIIGALISLSKKEGISQGISSIVSFCCLLLALLLLKYPEFEKGFFYVDGISKIMLVVITVIYFTTVVYSISYVKYIHNPLFEKNLYFFWLNLFGLSMIFSVIVNNLGLLWTGIEATTVVSALLIAIENHTEAIEATWRYILIVSVGLIISLLGTIFIFGSAHSLKFTEILHSNTGDKILVLGIILSIIGYCTKAGIFPMHTWLPDVHSKAPSPISAIFSAILLPVALFGVVRVIQIYPALEIKNFTFILGLATLIFASLSMSVQKFYKRLYAYSSMENMGIILIGISLGKMGLFGALIIILAHAFAKSAVFYLSGNILIRFKSTKIKDISNLKKLMPFTGFTLFFASLAATGAPPFATFVGEIIILSQILKNYGIIMAIITGIFITVAFISMNFYTGKMVFSEIEKDVKERKTLVNYVSLINVVLAFITLFFIPVINLLLK